MKKTVSNRGFTMIEVLLFVTILSIFFVTAVSVLVASLRNMQINEHKIIATRYAEELIEWLRSEKEEDINTFISRFSSTSQYCFNDPNNLDWTHATAGTCPNYNGLLPAIYKRELLYQIQPVGGGPCILGNLSNCRIILDVTVSWKELGNTYKVPLKTIVNLWEP